jgi:hypothetical protein
LYAFFDNSTLLLAAVRCCAVAQSARVSIFLERQSRAPAAATEVICLLLKEIGLFCAPTQGLRGRNTHNAWNATTCCQEAARNNSACSSGGWSHKALFGKILNFGFPFFLRKCFVRPPPGTTCGKIFQRMLWRTQGAPISAVSANSSAVKGFAIWWRGLNCISVGMRAERRLPGATDNNKNNCKNHHC